MLLLQEHRCGCVADASNAVFVWRAAEPNVHAAHSHPDPVAECVLQLEYTPDHPAESALVQRSAS